MAGSLTLLRSGVGSAPPKSTAQINGPSQRPKPTLGVSASSSGGLAGPCHRVASNHGITLVADQ